MKPLDLNEAVVVVTGAARGIGQATAKAFATAGATVHRGDLDPAGDPTVHPLDVTSRDSFAAFIDTVLAESGHIDVLVNQRRRRSAGVLVDRRRPSRSRRSTAHCRAHRRKHRRGRARVCRPTRSSTRSLRTSTGSRPRV
ncbi:SDR family NAD(P)-dependent oxidoreductase [Kribbella albertanoniae]|uniref:SDR family NAD(P)-dependent oxidoreductase n=1 Tax=Kribbella albertanoniae TaxID=1266829 RepID=A0A4V2XRD2_9ACTN|nr:SDR family NAD(P)-dependent oxidoreductase [Kribbella albertanoniae]